MLVAGFPAGRFQTNCWVLAPGEREQCVIVDPGEESVDGIEEILDKYHLHPVAVLLTHGHLDHTWSVVPVCQAKDVPAYLHPADRAIMSDPGLTYGMPPGSPLFGGLTFAEPDDLRLLTDAGDIELAGMTLRVDLTPGHTPGSIVFSSGDAGFLVAGDTLFKDSIGRMDLAGGSEEEMVDSVRRVILPMDDGVTVLPGHGEATTIGRERAHNPYLRMVQQGATDFSGGMRQTGL